ncbi:orotidine-5'-phosphate decarboxylase [Marininema halotolerans]|uniref:Orotidine 5'-phosphate decarboxylase n=1 Tax=Marininema halotolerans TaxID=1155944 RepID=A0A1I6QDR7_9BACL|nr:orotidine-5'-phosphate decarboxylase [Marininema halotolerans]SFS50438.1 orotidine-5'-phosphate decarboxylase [Marininema halotolerans]
MEAVQNRSLSTDEQVAVALDVPHQQAAEAFLKHWQGCEKPFIKVGMQLFYAAGPSFVQSLTTAGYNVFLDVKLHDIPNTVGSAVRSLTGLGVKWITLHASGGREMMEAAKKAAEEAEGTRPRLLAVTQLTSTDQRTLNQDIGIPGTVSDAALHLAELAQQSGMDGIVCSGEEARVMKERVPSLFIVTPGIRLEGRDSEDQKRVMTPEAAISEGADILVVGRPITRANEPLKVYKHILQRVEQARGNRE